MEILLILIVLVIALDFASLRWGFASTEKIDNRKWERRLTWYAHHES